MFGTRRALTRPRTESTMRSFREAEKAEHRLEAQRAAAMTRTRWI